MYLQHQKFQYSHVMKSPTMPMLDFSVRNDAIFIFSQENWKRMSESFPTESNDMIMTRLEEIWRSMPAITKQIYYDKAMTLALEREKRLREELTLRSFPFMQSGQLLFPLECSSENITLYRADETEEKTEDLSSSQIAQTKSSSTSTPTVVYLSKEIKKDDSSEKKPAGIPSSVENSEEQSQKRPCNSEECSPCKIPRPANAFMIFGKEHRKLLSKQYSNETNKSISVRLGQLWHELPKDIKDEYYRKAKLAEFEHRQKYPDYEYNPFEARKRKQLLKLARMKGKSFDCTQEMIKLTKTRGPQKEMMQTLFKNENLNPTIFIPKFRPQIFPFTEAELFYRNSHFFNQVHQVPVFNSVGVAELPSETGEFVEFQQNLVKMEDIFTDSCQQHYNLNGTPITTDSQMIDISQLLNKTNVIEKTENIIEVGENTSTNFQQSFEIKDNELTTGNLNALFFPSDNSNGQYLNQTETDRAVSSISFDYQPEYIQSFDYSGQNEVSEAVEVVNPDIQTPETATINQSDTSHVLSEAMDSLN